MVKTLGLVLVSTTLLDEVSALFVEHAESRATANSKGSALPMGTRARLREMRRFFIAFYSLKSGLAIETCRSAGDSRVSATNQRAQG
jgi:hypothetical protein